MRIRHSQQEQQCGTQKQQGYRRRLVFQRLFIIAICAKGLMSFYWYEIHESERKQMLDGDFPPLIVNKQHQGAEKNDIFYDKKCPLQDLFIVSWTHVPKAGGTAWVELAKRYACKENKNLFEDFDGIKNPCCIENLCLKDTRCDTSFAGGCPLVQNIGLHTFNGARIFDVSCNKCGIRWFQVSLDKGILKMTLRDPPKILNKLTQREIYSHKLWPLVERIRFFVRAGANHLSILKALRFNGIKNQQRLDTFLAIMKNVSCPIQYLQSNKMIKPFEQQILPTKNVSSLFFCSKTNKNIIGSSSITVIRHPFHRAASAYFYRGHSPNYDVFDLRPGLWLPPHIQRANVTLREYFSLPEYQNILTKMFGHDSSCFTAQRRGCFGYHGRDQLSIPISLPEKKNNNYHQQQNMQLSNKPYSCRCAVFEGCPAYRNDSILNKNHAIAAAKILKYHKFVAIQEAPQASALLATRILALENHHVLLNQTRPSVNLKPKCSPARVMRLEPQACRSACYHHSLDLQVYESLHRTFCNRLQQFQLLHLVQDELEKNRLCSTYDFSNPDHVCGPLETPDALDILNKFRTKCRRANNNPEWWLQHYGFYSDVYKGKKKKKKIEEGRKQRFENFSSDTLILTKLY
mmetsp:Transcript_22266/g.26786  ORF Transcript_22266/g.26786 Transcript_22266/m.26786 type:complete len:631 (+) Transcript_22266:103-1995(+)